MSDDEVCDLLEKQLAAHVALMSRSARAHFARQMAIAALRMDAAAVRAALMEHDAAELQASSEAAP